MQHTSLNKQQNTKAYKFLNQAASKSFMLLSLFLLLVPIARLSCGTAAGKYLDGVEGVRKDAAALVFLCFFGVESVDATHAIFSFPCSMPHLHCFSFYLLPFSLVSSLLLFS
jgi:hypothetical protein